MSLTDLIIQAKKKKADELLFIVGSEPRIRAGSGWESLRNSPAVATEWKLLQQSFLSDQQRSELNACGLTKGEVSFEDIRMSYSFMQSGATMKAHFQLDLDSREREIHIPQVILDTCMRMKGLVLTSGTDESAQALVIQRILQKIAEEKNIFGVVFSRKAFPKIKESNGFFVYHDGQFQSLADKEAFLAGVDCVVFDGYFDDSMFEQALSIAEKGVFVIYNLKAPTPMNALRRFLSVMGEKSREHGAGRVAEILTMMTGHYPASSLSGEKIFAHEVVLVKPQIRQMIEHSDIKGIEAMLGGVQEIPGILTLNQSLLQHLIRRRLDLKTAFEVSREPEFLDQLLKKVGI